MVSFDEVQPSHVLQALRAYDELGRDAFLDRYGFGRAASYLLVHEGRDYDSKAVLGAAVGYATGRPATHEEFGGGRAGAAKVLRDLGFDVIDTSARAGEETGTAATRTAWVPAARDVLVGAARRYQSVVTYSQLATQVQHLSGVTTRQLMHQWIGGVLLEVGRENARRSEPLLMSLCVDSRGRVGQGYRTAVESTTGLTLSAEDADDHAAEERLRCHQHFGAPDLPSSGGRPTLTPQVARARAARTPGVSDRQMQVCPTCHMAVPATGVCDECG